MMAVQKKSAATVRQSPPEVTSFIASDGVAHNIADDQSAVYENKEVRLKRRGLLWIYPNPTQVVIKL